jgi:hypothetical protein
MNTPLTRRRLLQLGGVGALGLGLPGTVTARVPTSGDGKPNGKSCIFVLLCGGPSHLDTWDMKPDAPAEIRGRTSRRPRPCPACASASCTRSWRS